MGVPGTRLQGGAMGDGTPHIQKVDCLGEGAGEIWPFDDRIMDGDQLD